MVLLKVTTDALCRLKAQFLAPALPGPQHTGLPSSFRPSSTGLSGHQHAYQPLLTVLLACPLLTPWEHHWVRAHAWPFLFSTHSLDALDLSGHLLARSSAPTKPSTLNSPVLELHWDVQGTPQNDGPLPHPVPLLTVHTAVNMGTSVRGSAQSLGP